MKAGEEAKLPQGHPAIGNSGKDTVSGDIDTKWVGDVNKAAAGHPSSGEVKREVRVPDEPANPAVLVELLEQGKGIAKGWVFTNFTAFNSYKHARYEIALPPISLEKD